jgi:hypothetical protein
LPWQALWLSLGEAIRRGEWSPHEPADAVPAEVLEMVSYAAARNVSLLAYVYPGAPPPRAAPTRRSHLLSQHLCGASSPRGLGGAVLPFVGDGAEPRNAPGGAAWL